MTKNDSLDNISAATENAIVCLGDTLVQSLTHGYDTAAKSTEEIVFPVTAESRNSMRRDSPLQAKAAPSGQEVTLDRAFAKNVDYKALEKEYEHMMAEKAVIQVPGTEKCKPAQRALPGVFPSFRKNRPRQQQQSQSNNHKKNEKQKKKKGLPRLTLYNR